LFVIWLQLGARCFYWLKQLSLRKDVAKGSGWVLLPVLYFTFVSPFAEDVYVCLFFFFFVVAGIGLL
jgi:hypothetical protein